MYMNRPQLPEGLAPTPLAPILAPAVLTEGDLGVLRGEDVRAKGPVLHRLGVMTLGIADVLKPSEYVDGAVQTVLGEDAPLHIALAAVQGEDGERGRWVVAGGPNTGDAVAERSYASYGLGDPTEELKVRREAEAAKKAEEQLSLRRETVTSILQTAADRSEIVMRKPEWIAELDGQTASVALDIINRIGNKPEGVALALVVAGGVQDSTQYKRLVESITGKEKLADQTKKQKLADVANSLMNVKEGKIDFAAAATEAQHLAQKAYREGDTQFAAQLLAMPLGCAAPGSGRVGLEGEFAAWINEQISADKA